MSCEHCPSLNKRGNDRVKACMQCPEFVNWNVDDHYGQAPPCYSKLSVAAPAPSKPTQDRVQIKPGIARHSTPAPNSDGESYRM